MAQIIMQYELAIRMIAFVIIFTVMALWEVLVPRRRLSQSKSTRWLNNLLIVVIDSLLVRLIFPAAAVGVALFAQTQGWGIFNYYSMPWVFAIIATVILLDLAVYLQHVMFHAISMFWRFHRMHHTDLDFDVTTGLRFHPVEIILSMLIKGAVILILGVPVAGVIIFEVLLNATSMFNHSNIRMSKKVDQVIRWIIVTPDMHRVHHSIEPGEANSNFGFNLSLWDRILGTYRAQPKLGHHAMTIGIKNLRKKKHVIWISGMLALPFFKEKSNYPINRRW